MGVEVKGAGDGVVIVLWTVSATWNTNSQIAAAKPKA